MTSIQTPFDSETLIRERFSQRGVDLSSLERRDYPEETIFIARVDEEDFAVAANLGNEIDYELEEHGVKGFVTVRRAEQSSAASSAARLKLGVLDARATVLVNLVTARSRTSEIQPSLSYVPDAAKNILTVTAPRHQLIFGRRGAGKTALMVEAKRRVDKEGHSSTWINLQTLRHAPASLAYVWVCQRVCELIQAFYAGRARAPQVLTSASALRDTVELLISAGHCSDDDANNLIPRMQDTIRRFLETNALRLYIFLDDLHYLTRGEQPKLLDMVHGSIRDCDAWLKVAGIKHLSRWFQTNPPLGLQTGHDADHIDLDLTLEHPSRAKDFLEKVLRSYASHVGITSLLSVLSSEALDRLVLASGAVPRDYLVLSAAAIRQAQRREKARLVGVQDVNKAAGDAAKVKIAELEDDAASAEGTTQAILGGLQTVRKFCIDEKNSTYFRIDFQHKEVYSTEYGIMQDLLDLRLIHLVDASLSDEREAGRRSEVYMLDLSQFSGQRLKRKLKVLDFEAGHIVLKETGTNTETKVGDTPKLRLGLLRRGPLFDLERLTSREPPGA